MRALLLGPLEVYDDAGAPVTVPGAMQRRLLALLAVHAGEVVSADRIVDVLWGEEPLRDPANAVQAKIAQLRRLLEPRRDGAPPRVLVRRPPGYLLHLDPDDLDVTAFARLAGHGRDALAAGDAATAADRFRAALALWRGLPLAEFAGEEFAAAPVARWEEERAAVLEDRVEADLALGNSAGLVAELQALVAAHPTRERLRALLMRALYAAGRQADALAAFHDARRFLDEELGVAPGPQLRAAFEAVLHQDPALTSNASAHPIPPVPAVAARRLPAPLTRIVGRDEEVEAVVALLGDSRLVTLTGPGGVGKTRLALEVAHRISGDGGVAWWVDLSVVGSPDALVPEIAAALGLADERAAGGPAADLRARLAAALTERPALVVLDDAEHLVAAVAELARELLAAAAGLALLVTSRQPLGVPGERVCPVAPLDCPPQDAADGEADALRRSPAVELFLDRVSAAAPGFALDEATAPAVAAVCRELDGLPLALELAAVKVRTLGVAELARRLDDRFRLLASRTGGPRRRQTLEAVMRWSWDLLDDTEQTLLARPSVLSGRWTLTAAERVCADGSEEPGRADEVAGEPVADLLARLADKSLLVVETTAGEPRYRLLETVRRFAADRLSERGEQEAARRALVSYIGELAAPATAALRGAAQLATAHRLEEERADIRTALTWAAGAEDRAPLTRLVTDLCWYWYLTGQPEEALRWLRLVPRTGDAAESTPETALAALWAAFLGVAAEGPAAAWDRVSDLVPALDAGTPEQRVIGGCLAVVLARGTGDDEAAERIATATRWVAVAADDRHGLATLDYLDALPPAQHGDLATAGERLTTALDRFAEAGDRWGQVQSLNGLYTVAEAAGDLARAGAILDRALELAEELGIREMQAVLLTRCAALGLRRGDAAGAAAAAQRARSAAAEVGAVLVTAMAEHTAGLAARGLGRLPEALAAQQAALAVYRRAGVPTGAAATLRELGALARLAGDADRARRLHRDALQQARAGGDPRLVASVLESIAVDTAAGLSATGTDGEDTHDHDDASAARQVLEVLAAARALRGGDPPDDPAEVDAATARARTVHGDEHGDPGGPDTATVERLLDELVPPAEIDGIPRTAEPGRSG